ncbi:MAG: hypothetical protein WCG06_04315 [Candidatus Omnitrophota bacterium]
MSPEKELVFASSEKNRFKTFAKEFLKKNLSFISVFLRLCRVLSPKLQLRSIRLFLLMITVGVMEFMSIIAITIFAMTLNAPETLRAQPWVSGLLSGVPALETLCGNNGNLILAACLLAALSVFVKNALWLTTHWKMILLSEDIAGYIGRESMNRFLHMPYTWHLSVQGADAFFKISWRHALGQFALQNLVVFSNLITVALLFTGLMMLAPVPMFIVLIFFCGRLKPSLLFSQPQS